VSRLGPLRSRLHPTSRKGAVGLVLAGILGMLLVCVLAVGAVVAIPWAYNEYGYHPAKSAQSWAALDPQYATSAACQRCHPSQYAAWQGAKHATLSCGTCHGPLAEHVATAPEPAAPAASVGPAAPGASPAGASASPVASSATGAPAASPIAALAKPTAAMCVLCHQRVPGRPAAFPTVDLAAHYAGASCLGCHDAHTATAVKPPDISHSLDNLPACITCHKPNGLKPVPDGHVEAQDSVCQTCHKRPTAGQ
jgi:hypothetical protein